MQNTDFCYSCKRPGIKKLLIQYNIYYCVGNNEMAALLHHTIPIYLQQLKVINYYCDILKTWFASTHGHNSSKLNNYLLYNYLINTDCK